MSEIGARAFFKHGKIIVKTQDNVKILQEAGYGNLYNDNLPLVLSNPEALYLLSEEKISIINSDDGRQLSFTELAKTLHLIDKETWTKYLIYRDLRSRGYVVRDGFGFGIDFRVYERGEYDKKVAKFVVWGIHEGMLISLHSLMGTLHAVQNMKKELILAVIDRRGEIVYYLLSQLTF